MRRKSFPGQGVGPLFLSAIACRANLGGVGSPQAAPAWSPDWPAFRRIRIARWRIKARKRIRAWVLMRSRNQWKDGATSISLAEPGNHTRCRRAPCVGRFPRRRSGRRRWSPQPACPRRVRPSGSHPGGCSSRAARAAPRPDEFPEFAPDTASGRRSRLLPGEPVAEKLLTHRRVDPSGQLLKFA